MAAPISTQAEATMAKNSTTTFFDPEFAKIWSNGKTANLDMNWLISYQRKNIEALTVANQRAFEGVQAIAKAQAEFVREAAEELQKVTKELVGAGSTEDKFVKQ